METYCQIYVDSPYGNNKRKLVEQIAALLGGTVAKSDETDVSAKGFEYITVMPNFDAGAAPPDSPPSDAFLFYSHIIEIDGSNLKTLKAGIGKLLEGLWAAHIPAVAACDYEDDLPEAGGYHAEHRWKTDSDS